MSAATPFRLIDAPTAPQDLIDGDCPRVPLKNLDTLWIQVTGTLCNIQCAHCFISCGPSNRDLAVMPRTQIQGYLAEARELGVKEYYFTGGEPFIHGEMVEILDDTLAQGPATVLTNAMLLRAPIVERLRAVADRHAHTLTFRVSLDGFDAATNDAIRGPGSFDKAFEGMRRLAQAGFNPIVTATRTWPCSDECATVGRFTSMLKDLGIEQPRLKVLPNLHIGREAERSRAYADRERVTACMMDGFDLNNLICHSARIATAEGVRVCPILVGAEDATMGMTLKDSLGDYPLRHRTCHTCFAHGAICSNDTSAAASPDPDPTCR